MTQRSDHARLSAAALAISGVFFAIYPALRPFSDEVTLAGAAAFGADAWLVAHMLAMVAFTLLPVGLFGLYRLLEDSPARCMSAWALVIGQVGVGFTLPFYGGEAYGLHAIGQEALARQDASLLSIAAAVRAGPGLLLFLSGLLLLGGSAILAAIAIWRSGRYPIWSGVPLALGLALYIPQFFGTQPLRVAHGLLVAVGCLWVALDLWRGSAATYARQVAVRGS
ncbi:hypothetical protein K2Z83_26005 [Oscillochloris sp. ZM17-4]|uniref:hypothetical protein n=1 Tax=Oscillochloris sp. ZM17-4 TaxID=2866714 RepID=UPI001C7399CC|nr:hypothetical protein [Oscillochloris sp. ZM17-4]MBX0331107.1 hypothetical protein [Oscillochloris sp. ZM17-4]